MARQRSRWRSLLLIVSAVGLVLSFRPLGPADGQDSNRFLAERIATSGHGLLFDENGREIRMSPASMSSIQAAILAEVSKERPAKVSAEAAAALERARRLLQTSDLRQSAAVLLRGGIIARLLDGAPKSLVDRYAWRNEALLTYYWNHNPGLLTATSPEIIELYRLLIPDLRIAFSAYLEGCRVRGVPIPPDWAKTGTAWQFQGELTEDLLQGMPGDALVWTFSDPKVRGACVAIMRGAKAGVRVGDVICQSAMSGHACFWENIIKGDPEKEFIDWKTKPLPISQLEDGATLPPCPQCHHGNNAFLISPDDPTWAKVLRGPLSGPSAGTFTTRVELSRDHLGGHYRYIPWSGTLPPRPGWENKIFKDQGCWGACHEKPTINNMPPMPPDCALPSTTKPAHCYAAAPL